MSKFTAQHFPKGTVILTSLYTTDENGFKIMRFGTDKPATFVVDHIRVADTFNGRIYLLVTTTRKEEPLFEGDDFITFNIEHVDRVLKMGTVADIRYNGSQNKWGLSDDKKNILNEYSLKMVLLNMFNTLQPQNQYDLKKTMERVVADGCVKRKVDNTNQYIQRIIYIVNKRKLKAWAKKNINRMIFTQKEIQGQKRLADAELSRDLEDLFDSDLYCDNAQISVEDDMDRMDYEQYAPRPY